jgi:hypothetical protein
MGNHSSSSMSCKRSNVIVSKTELNEKCLPSGLYESCSWEYRAIRRLIRAGKLAGRLRGKDNRETGKEHECPICTLHYDEINMLKCCNAMICTECFLQLEDPKERDKPCPFCKTKHMSLVVAKGLDEVDKLKREEEEQKVMEATIQARTNSESIMLTPLSTEQASLTQEQGVEDIERSSIDSTANSEHSNSNVIPDMESDLFFDGMTPYERNQIMQLLTGNDDGVLSNYNMLQAAMQSDAIPTSNFVHVDYEAQQLEMAISLSLAESHMNDSQNIVV